jgi:hypothetical protein
VTQQPIPDSTAPPASEPAHDQSGDQPQSAEINWEERAKAAESRLEGQESETEKLSDRLKTVEGRVKKQESTESVIAGFSDTLAGIQAGTVAMAKAMSNDSLDTLGDEVAAIEQNTQSKVAAASSRSIASSLGEDLQAAVQDSEGASILDLQTASELESVRETWNTGLRQIAAADAVQRAEGRATLMQAVSDAKTAALAAERTRASERMTALEAEHKAQREKWAEEHGVEDLSVGTGSASVGGNLLGKLGDPAATVSRDDIVKAAEQFRKQGIRI